MLHRDENGADDELGGPSHAVPKAAANCCARSGRIMAQTKNQVGLLMPSPRPRQTVVLDQERK